MPATLEPIQAPAMSRTTSNRGPAVLVSETWFPFDAGLSHTLLGSTTSSKYSSYHELDTSDLRQFPPPNQDREKRLGAERKRDKVVGWVRMSLLNYRN